MTSDQVKWLILTEKGKELGPYSTQGVFNLIKSGQLNGFEQIKKFPNGEWILISKKAQFYDQLIDALERGPSKVPQRVFEETVIQKRDHTKETPAQNSEDEATQIVKPLSSQELPVSLSLKETLDRIKNAELKKSETGKNSLIGKVEPEVPTKPEAPISNSLSEAQIAQIKSGARVRKNLSVFAVGLISIGLICILLLIKPEKEKKEISHETETDVIRLMTPKTSGQKIEPQAYEKIFRTAVDRFFLSTIEDVMESQKLLISLIEANPSDLKSRGLLCLVYFELWPFVKKETANFEAVNSLATNIRRNNSLAVQSVQCETIKLFLDDRLPEARGLLEYSMNTIEYMNDPILYYLRALVMAENQDFVAASAYMQEAAANLKNWPKIFLELSRLNLVLKKYDELKTNITLALQLNPKFRSAKLIYGSYLAEIEKNTQAAQSTLQGALSDNSISLNSDIARAAFNQAILYSVSDKMKAKFFAQMSFDYEPTERRYSDLLVQLGGSKELTPLAIKNFDLMSSADKLKRRGDCLGAEAEYRAIFARDSKNSIAAYKAGLCLAERNKLKHAVEWMDKAIASDPQNARAYKERALYLTERFEFDNAVSGLISGLKTLPNNSELFKALGVVEFRRNNFIGAIEYLQKAKKSNDSDVEILSYLANSLIRNPQTVEEAKSFANRAKEIDPGAIESVEAYSNVLAATEGVNASINYIKNDVIKKFSYNLEYRLILANLNYKYERYTEASKILIQLTDADPKNKEAWLLAGDSSWAQANARDAIEAYSKAAIIDSTDARAFLKSGIVYLETGKTAEAIKKFELAERSNSKMPKLRLWQGKAAMAAGQLEAALKFFDQEKLVNPGVVDSYIYSADIYASNRKYQKCIEEFQQIIALKEQGAKSYVKLARCHRLAGNSDAAQDMLEQAFQRESGYADIYKEQGAVFESRGENLSAAESYNKYIILSPNASDRSEVEKRILSIGGRLNGNN